MSRYQGYYKKKAEQAPVGAIKASTSRETPFYEEPAVTLSKWRAQMQEVFSAKKMKEFNQVKSKEDFDRWMEAYGIRSPRVGS